MLDIRKVLPSGSALATAAEPIRPPAPPLFSTKKLWPNLSVSCSASRRPSVSDVPPGANGDTIRTGFAGQSAALAAIVPAAIANVTHTATSPRFISNSGIPALGSRPWTNHSVSGRRRPARLPRAPAAKRPACTHVQVSALRFAGHRGRDSLAGTGRIAGIRLDLARLALVRPCGREL